MEVIKLLAMSPSKGGKDATMWALGLEPWTMSLKAIFYI